MEIKAGKKFWAMKSSDNILLMDYTSETLEGCWNKFIYTALNREAYEEAGWKPVRAYITEDKNQ